MVYSRMFILTLLLCVTAQSQAAFQFAPPVSFPTLEEPFYILSADFNNDGHPDLAVCSRRGSSVSIYPGNGLGDFPTRTDILLGEDYWTTGMVLADMNGDGITDIVVNNYGAPDNTTESISVLYGDGTGAFSDPAEFDTGGPTPAAVVAADFDGDGRNDIAVANRAGHTVHTGDVAILLQTSPGVFVANPNRLPGHAPRSLFADDLDNDGAVDLVSANFLTPSIYVFRGKGDGTFHDFVRLETALGPVNLQMADVNEDGQPDLIAANRRAATGQPGVSIYLGLTGAGFRDPIFLPAGELPATVAVADLDGDSHHDIVVANGFSDDIILYHGDGRGAFTDPETISLQSGITPRSIIATDLDHDGDLDLGLVNKLGNTLMILINQQAQPVGVSTVSAELQVREPGVVDISWKSTDSASSVHVYRQMGNVHTSPGRSTDRIRLTDSPLVGYGRHSFTDRSVIVGHTYSYWLESTDLDGTRQMAGPYVTTVTPPEEYELAQNAPNPFNPDTVISYRIARPGHVRITIYNLVGEEVATLVNEVHGPGYFTARWDGRDSGGNAVGSGVYVYTLRAGAFTSTRRMTLLK